VIILLDVSLSRDLVWYEPSSFLSREGQEVEEESKLMTILVMVDVQSGWPHCMQLPDESSASPEQICFAQHRPIRGNLRWCSSTTLNLLSVVWHKPFRTTWVHQRYQCGKLRHTQGAVESMNAFAQSQIRALWLDTRER